MKDVSFCEGIVSVMGPEVFQCPIGDVLPAVFPVFVVGVQGEALGTALWQLVGNIVDHQRKHRPFLSHLEPYHPILLFCLRCGEDGGKYVYTLSHHLVKVEV